MYDVIVVGARCAGAPTAMLLARKGHRVLLVDKATFPSDTMSTHCVQLPAVDSLRRWGLLDRVIATGCPPMATYALDFGAVALRGHPTPVDGVDRFYAPRRTILDALLVEAAAAAGATVETGFAVEGLIHDNGAVAGVEGRTDAGSKVSERARLVVGADGLHSIVAAAVDAPVYDDRGTLQCAYYSYWSGVEVDGFDAFDREVGAAAAIPTNDGLTCIPVVWPRARFKEIRSDIERHYLAVLDETPLAGGVREDRWHGTADLPNFFRHPYGPGWALVGDAGYYQDPITAHGITNAFRDAELLVDAVDTALRSDRDMQAALAEFHEQRDAAARPMFELTCQVAAPGPPPPDFVALLRALVGNQPATDTFFGMLAGTVHADEFFAPDNVAAVLGGGVSTVS